MVDRVGLCRGTINSVSGVFPDRSGFRPSRWCRALPVLLLALLGSACGNYTIPGSYDGAGVPPASSGTSAGSTGQVKNCDQLFSLRVQPRLEFCRNCHVPGGVADVDGGRLFQLTTDRGADFANLRSSWERTGRNDNGKSPILKMASGTDTRTHTGGAPWPVGSDAYKEVDAQLLGFVDPQACVLSGLGGAGDALPLLGAVHGRGTRQLFCEGRDGKTPQPDAAVMPQDARELVQPGVNAGKAVAFNAWWENCKVNLPASDQAPKTCGEFRKLRDEGNAMQNYDLSRQIWKASTAANGGGTTAEAYNDTWKKWGGGLTRRPDNFDAMWALRYGDNQPHFRNPYPIRKADGTMEDPNAPGSNGGSGQLPLGYSQMKDDSGKWTGIIASGGGSCAGCHGGQVGLPGEAAVAGAWWGIPNNNADPVASNLDSDPSSPTAAADQFTKTLAGFGLFAGPRGLNDASTGYELLAYVLLDWQSLDLAPDPAKHKFGPDHGRSWQDSPSWFHQGHQARKFKSGEISIDAHRMTAAACGGPGGAIPTAAGAGAASSAYRDYCGQRLAAFQESLESPHWPEDIRPIDTKLAEQGAILFHTKNLWASPGNASRPKPAGSGSCAGCHGAYSPRFVNDAAYLSTPELEGMASYIVPMEIIGSEPVRQNMTGTDFATTWNASWWSYPEGTAGYIGPGSPLWNPVVDQAENNYPFAISPLAPKGACQWSNMGVVGYLAPALHGIWATAPYMHNGSVPTLGQMLDSRTRPTIWRRKTQKIGPVEGFDQSFATGFDFERVGWKYDEIKCADYPNDPNLGCNPVDPAAGPPLGTLAMDMLQGKLLWTGLLHPQYIENPDLRFIRDSRHTGNGNQGHEFTDVLTDQERKAIIEYLKTL